MKHFIAAVVFCASCLLAASGLQAADLPETVLKSTGIVEKKQGSVEPIPASSLAAAKGVAIFDITKGGLVFGGAGGDGIVVLRRGAGWTAPIPLGYGGGSFGAQIGVTSMRLIILLNSDQAVRVFTNPGKVEWNAAATGTAGKDTEGEQAGGLLSDKDVTIYKESGGLFAGATFGGASINIQNDRIQNAYGGGKYVRDIVEGRVPNPEYARRLYVLLDGKR